MHKILNNYSALLVGFIGLVFSAWNAFFKDTVFCLTSSCNVLADFALFGLSLWVYSFAFFALVNTLLITKKTRTAFVFLAIALMADIGLLILMLFTSPCFNCLIVALCYALAFFILAFNKPFKKISYALLVLWFVFFLINLGAIGKSFVNPYVIYMNEEYREDVYSSSMRIFFSPTCSACNEAVQKLGSEEVTLQADIAWIPVPESYQDIILIVQLDRLIKEGKSLKDALVEMQLNPEKSSIDSILPELIMQVKLLVNQSLLDQRGTTRIPFVEYTGLPAHISAIDQEQNVDDEPEEINMLEILRKMSPDAEENAHQSQNQSKDNNIGVNAFCDKSNDEDC